MEDEVEIKYKSTRLQLFGKTRRGFSRYKFVSYSLNPTRSHKALFWSPLILWYFQDNIMQFKKNFVFFILAAVISAASAGPVPVRFNQ